MARPLHTGGREDATNENEEGTMSTIRPLAALAACASTLGLAGFGGCATAPTVQTVTGAQAPAWVASGSRASGDGGEDDGDGAVFMGVGAASGVNNHALARRVADQRARAEIARMLDTYVTAMMEDYSATTTARDFSATSEEQNVSDAIRSFTSRRLHGVEIVDHFTDPGDGTVYALAHVDLARFAGALAQAEQLDNAMRDYVQRNAREAFDRLEREEARRSGGHVVQ